VNKLNTETVTSKLFKSIK